MVSDRTPVELKESNVEWLVDSLCGERLITRSGALGDSDVWFGMVMMFV